MVLPTCISSCAFRRHFTVIPLARIKDRYRPQTVASRNHCASAHTQLFKIVNFEFFFQVALWRQFKTQGKCLSQDLHVIFTFWSGFTQFTIGNLVDRWYLALQTSLSFKLTSKVRSPFRPLHKQEAKRQFGLVVICKYQKVNPICKHLSELGLAGVGISKPIQYFDPRTDMFDIFILNWEM